MSSVALAIEDRLEFTIARDVQERFMRHTAPAIEGVDYSAKCRQARELGGDYYDFVPLADSRMALAVGDASGKGLPAALMISNVQSSLRTAGLFTGNDGAAMLSAVNRQVYATSLLERYATLFYAVVDGINRTLRYVNAGHPAPLIARRDGSIEWLDSSGAPVGMFEDWAYEENTVQLRSGDLVVAFSDGVIEAENRRGETWGIEGLRRAATENNARNAGDVVNAIFKSMDQYSGGRHLDDATVVVLRIL